MKIRIRFPVSTFGLSPDLKRVHPEFKKINRGDVTSQKLSEVLEGYRQIDTDWGPLASYIAIEAETGRFLVRISGKQLTLTPEGQTPPSSVPLTSAEIIARLEQSPTITVAPPQPPVEPLWRTVTTLVLLATGVVLMAQALMPILAPRAAPPPDIKLVTDPADLQARQKSVVGLFGTGQKPGDRSLTVSAQGHVVFAESGPRQSLGAGTDSFQIGRRDQQTFLVTPRSGVIEVVDANTLVYYGDAYRRIN